MVGVIIESKTFLNPSQELYFPHQMKDKSVKKCIYCRSRKANSRDHVPPKNLFPIPRPANLITVPSCVECNRFFKKDEDYFLALSTFTDAGISTEGKKLWQQKLHRMYVKDVGLRRIIANSFATVELITPAGVYIGRRGAIKPNWDRIKNYASS